MQRVALFAPLRHPSFRRLFAGQIISDLGDWVDYLALVTLLVYRWKLGPTALAALSVAMVLPWVVVAPLAGVWTDRWPRRRVLVAADLARAAVVLGLVWAPNLAIVLVLVAFKGIFSVFFLPARQAAIKSTVPAEDLLQASSLSRVALDAMKVIGMAAGGLLVSLLGPRGVFVVDALSFLLSAAILAGLPPLPVGGAAPERAGRSFWREWKEGLRYIVRQRTLALAIGGMTLGAFVILAYDSLSPLALKSLGLNEAQLGLAVGGVGLGTAAGAAAIGQWGNRLNPLGLMGGGKFVSGALVAAVGVAVTTRLVLHPLAWMPLWPVIGLSVAAIMVPYSYVLQRETPPALMGRVFSTASGLQTAFQLVAPLVGAALAEWMGVGFVLVAGGTGLLVLGGLVLLMARTMEPATSTPTET